MDTALRKRVAKGIPTSGQFAEESRSESSLTLSADSAGASDYESIESLADEIRLGLSGSRRSNTDALDARERLIDTFGSMDRAAIEAGSRIKARGEELSGMTAEQAQEAWAERLRAAEEETDAARETRPVGREYFDAMTTQSRISQGRDDGTQADMRRMADGYLAALSEVRPMGGKISTFEGSSPLAVKHLQEAAKVFPTEWIHHSNSFNPLLVERAPRRAHYRNRHTLSDKTEIQYKSTRNMTEDEFKDLPVDPRGEWKPTGEQQKVSNLDRSTGLMVESMQGEYQRTHYRVMASHRNYRPTKDGSPRGKGWEQWTHPETDAMYWRQPHTYTKATPTQTISQLTVGGRKVSHAEGREPDFAVAAHEFGHRAEYAVRGVFDLESEFLRRRTLADPENDPATQEKMVAAYGSRKELVRPDHFADKYMGKHYSGGESTEIMSTGVESLFAGENGGLVGTGSYRADPEMASFVLGVLGTAGGKKTPGADHYVWD